LSKILIAIIGAEANAIALPITGPVAYIPDAIPLSFFLNHVATSFGDPEEAIGPPKLNKPTDSSKDIKLIDRPLKIIEASITIIPIVIDFFSCHLSIIFPVGIAVKI
jgi:hypothetical protein